MAKALRFLAALALLLLADTWLPRASWMPPPLLTRSVLEARWWPFVDAPPAEQLAATETEADDEDSDDDTDEPAPAAPVVVTAPSAAVATTAPAAAPSPKTPPAARPAAPRKPAAPEVALAKAFVAPASAGWDDFRERLSDLENGKRTKVRVVQLGDSEIAGDWVTRTLRKQFSRRYGEGGLGFALAMAPWPWYWREGYRHEEPDGFSVKSFVFGHRADGNYGPGGIGFDSNRKGASATVALRHPPEGECEVSFHYGTTPGGGAVEVFGDATKLDHIETAAADRTPQVKRYTLKACPSKLTATVVTDAKVRLFGWTVEATRSGIVWSSLGVVSANASQLQHYGSAQLVQALQDLRPDLIIVGYGLNLVHSGLPPPSAERQTFQATLADLRGGMKDARCLVLSPYPVVVSQDGTLSPSTAVSVLARYQRDAASQAGCAFLDRERLSGGPETGLKWLESKPRILSGDYVHLTEKGSERMGMQLARVLLDSKPEML